MRLLSRKRFLEEEWDYAIVLDACRYDLFKEVNTIDGKLEKKQSIASATMEWVSRAIRHEHKDIILVNTNPYLSDLKIKELTGFSKPFYKNIKAWIIGWDDELNTTPPWAMVEISNKRIKKYQGKRFIFWFNQPHHPFLVYQNNSYRSFAKNTVGDKSRKMWFYLGRGDINLKEAWNAYKENLKIALRQIEKLLGYLDGKIIITSDHGNCFGEMGLFAHPQRVHIPPLIEVPYLELYR